MVGVAHPAQAVVAGVGFPGLALAAALPDAHLHLVESVGRKGEWLRRAAEFAGLTNVEVVVARAEEWHAQVDVVTARALAPLPVLAEYAAPLLRDGGVLVSWKGTPERDEVVAGARAAAQLGLRAEPPLAVEPYPRSGTRHLYGYRKVAPTPPRFPRRAGMAAKRPLGGAGARAGCVALPVNGGKDGVGLERGWSAR